MPQAMTWINCENPMMAENKWGFSVVRKEFLIGFPRA
jgi:hypothetical protein